MATACRADVYVSPTGNDASPGTLAAPVQTLAQAQALARSQGAAGVHVYLRGGTYYLSSPLALTAADGGETWQAYNGEVPVISGGVSVTGWTLHDSGNNIWQASVPPGTDFRQLYVNGVRAVRAFTTNVAALLPGGAHTATGFSTTSATPMASWGNPSAVEFVFDGFWTDNRIEVTAIASNAVTLSAPFWAYANNQTTPSPLTSTQLPVSIENAYELLSASTPGEFYLNKSTSVLYYVPRAGESLATATVVYPAQQTLVSVSGAGGVSFVGVTFTGSNWTGPDSGGVGMLDLQSCYYHREDTGSGVLARVPSAVSVLAGSTGTVFQGCTFRGLGADGLFSAGGCSGTQVIGSLFTDISGSAIDVTDYLTDKAIDTTGVRIADNTVHDVGVEYRSAAAMNVVYVDGASIDHNVLFNLPYTGITLGLGWGKDSPDQRRNNSVHHNVIHDFMKLLSDGGAIYTNSNDPGETDYGNVAYNLGGVPEGTGAMYASCYYLDDGSLGKTVSNNVGYNVAGQLYHCNDNAGPNTLQFNFFDTGAGFEGIGPEFVAANTYTANATVGTLLPQSLISAAGLEPQWGGSSPSPPPSLTCPQFLTAQKTNGGTAALLDWTAPVSDPGGLKLYEVWQGATLVATTAAPSYTFPNVSAGSTYTFTVDAVDASGNISGRSNPASLSF